MVLPPLVLFDLDGTLVGGASPAHADAFAAALADRYGAGDPFRREGDLITCGGRPLGGRLDAEIARWCLEAAGVAVDELDGYCRAVAEHYVAVAGGRTGAAVLPGVTVLLEGLRAEGVPCGVLTGNLEPIARRKLEAAGLLGYFRRSGRLVGAFGEPPARERSELFVRAAGRATEAGDAFAGLVYVGDTPLDAAAAAAAGVRFVGVATGRYGRRQLAAAAGDAPVLAGLDAPGAPEVVLGIGT